MRVVLFPTSAEELFASQQSHPDARLMAGGTDLLVRLRHGPADTRPLLCLERLAELGGITFDGARLFIGAATTMGRLAGDPLVARHCPVLAAAAATVGGPALRTMATLGGNLCTASPAGDTLPALHVLAARVVLRSAGGTREVGVADFITGPGRTVLQPGELLVGVNLPDSRAFATQHFEKVGRRQALAIAVASLAALLRFDDEGRVAEARLAWGSVGPVIVRSPEAERALVGRTLDKNSLTVAAALAQAAAAPIDDVRATATYRRQLVGNLLFRLLSA